LTKKNVKEHHDVYHTELNNNMNDILNRRQFLKASIGATLIGVSPFTALSSHAAALGMEAKVDLQKTRLFNTHFHDDIFVTDGHQAVLKSVYDRFRRVIDVVGYTKFALIDFDETLKIARNYPQIGVFPKEEIAFLEFIFYFDAKVYGFWGDKLLTEIDVNLSRKSVKKISGTAQYLFRGDAEKVYGKIHKVMGDRVILTSGVRGVVKQLYLFLKKVQGSKGNLSMASRSIAPPGHSFHGVGDFDVGKTDFGYRNFTSSFAQTDEYKRLTELGYLNIRYPKDNPFGVRFEPWHVKVV